MSALLKTLVVLMAVVCLFQFVEMAPPKEEPSHTQDLANAFDHLTQALGKAFNDPSMQKVVKNMQDMIASGSEKAKDLFHEFNENMKKELAPKA